MAAETASGGAVRPFVEIAGVGKRFGEVVAVDDLSLSLRRGEFFALLGPSGCGKTTLMRLLAGFEQPETGTIRLDGADITAVPPHLRPINLMFQSYALFPHLSVTENIAYGLKREGMPKPAIAGRVAEMLALVKLDGLGARRPDQLSGGQRQRVALARSLAKRPKLLLLDEPLAALDRKLREETQFELVELQRRLGTTFLVVTHDQDEAMSLADRMAVMEGGRISQIGPPRAVYEAPASRSVARFLGDVNLLEGVVAAIDGDEVMIETGQFGLVAARRGATVLALGQAVALALRPEMIALVSDGRRSAGENSLPGTVQDVGYFGDTTMLRVAVGEGTAIIKVSIANSRRGAAGRFARGDRVMPRWDAEAGIILTR